MINKFSKLTESTSVKFKIGLDLHGVIDALPEFFAFLTDSGYTFKVNIVSDMPLPRRDY